MGVKFLKISESLGSITHNTQFPITLRHDDYVAFLTMLLQHVHLQHKANFSSCTPVMVKELCSNLMVCITAICTI